LEEEVTGGIPEDRSLPFTLVLYGRQGERACHVSTLHPLHIWQGAERVHARHLMHLSCVSTIENI